MKYETKKLRLGYGGKRKLEKYVAAGWEVVNSTGGHLGTVQTVILRRPK